MNNQPIEILKESIENNQMNIVARIPKNMESRDRNSLGGLHRNETPLHIFPMTPSFDICHIIPYKYLGIENDTNYLFGASRQINNEMREPERKLDELLNHYNVIYDVEIKVVNSKLEVNINIEAYDEFEKRQDGYMYYIESLNCDNHFYIYQLEPLIKNDIRDKISNQDNSTTSNKMFNEQWNEYKKKATMLDGSVVEGVQITPDTFIDIAFNQYFHKEESTIVDQIDGINWIYGQYISYIVGSNKDLVVYAESLEDVIKLTVIKDSNNKAQTLYDSISNNLNVFDLSDVIQENKYELTLYRRSHSKLYKRAWELESGEIAEIDEETMTVYPAQYENGSKAGISFKDRTSTLITGGVGSGKTSAIKTMIMPFIKSEHADVAILDMKESNDWVFAKDYVQTLINENSGKTGHALLHELYKESKQRRKMLPEKYSNIWEVPKKERPFNIKIVVIDEFHKLMKHETSLAKTSEYPSYISHMPKYQPSDIYRYMVKTCRDVGIHFICLTQLSFSDDLGYHNRSLFNTKISLRGGNYNFFNNDTVRMKIKGIPNDDTGRGVGVVATNEQATLMKFGYYSNAALCQTIEKFEKPNPKEIMSFIINDDSNELNEETEKCGHLLEQTYTIPQVIGKMSIDEIIGNEPKETNGVRKRVQVDTERFNQSPRLSNKRRTSRQKQQNRVPVKSPNKKKNHSKETTDKNKNDLFDSL